MHMGSTTISDTTLQENVLAEISFDPAINPGDVGITVAGGFVTVRGTVASYSQKVLVEQTAKRARVCMPSRGVRWD